jgi:hypothetical protein
MVKKDWFWQYKSRLLNKEVKPNTSAGDKLGFVTSTQPTNTKNFCGGVPGIELTWQTFFLTAERT